eukprot:1175907-Prorocentrum_minimum.AAC.2
MPEGVRPNSLECPLACAAAPSPPESAPSISTPRPRIHPLRTHSLETNSLKTHSLKTHSLKTHSPRPPHQDKENAGEAATLGLATMWDLLLQRPPLRQRCLSVVLQCTVAMDEGLRGKVRDANVTPSLRTVTLM